MTDDEITAGALWVLQSSANMRFQRATLDSRQIDYPKTRDRFTLHAKTHALLGFPGLSMNSGSSSAQAMMFFYTPDGRRKVFRTPTST